ncbi:MAG: AAA family ATPase [Pseudomonadota bacterium]
MKRKIYDKLKYWKNSKTRKPLIIQGARQVGKSYILNEFGKNEFKNHYNFNFEKDKKLKSIFEESFDPDRIIKDLSFYLQKPIIQNEDLIIFDEIQECPKAITSLKYFSEEKPNLAICCAGSLIGVTLSKESFPVGKVNFLNLYPMDFEEFILASNNEITINTFYSFLNKENISGLMHSHLWDQLTQYFVIGGMPQVISNYMLSDEDPLLKFNSARTLQKDIMNSYFKDFAKHAGKTNSMHIAQTFENVPVQLAKTIDDSTSRFKFKGVLENKRSYNELQGPISWLSKAGLALKVKICNKAQIPFKAFSKDNIFKLFLFDTGLLGAMLEIPTNSLINQDYGMTKGFFAENFIAQELSANLDKEIYSWSERNSEIEFLLEFNSKIIPLEVKSGTRTQAKSLSEYIKKYSPEIAIKLSNNPPNYNNKNIIKNLPLYSGGNLTKFL